MTSLRYSSSQETVTCAPPVKKPVSFFKRNKLVCLQQSHKLMMLSLMAALFFLAGFLTCWHLYASSVKSNPTDSDPPHNNNTLSHYPYEKQMFSLTQFIIQWFKRHRIPIWVTGSTFSLITAHPSDFSNHSSSPSSTPFPTRIEFAMFRSNLDHVRALMQTEMAGISSPWQFHSLPTSLSFVIDPPSHLQKRRDGNEPEGIVVVDTVQPESHPKTNVLVYTSSSTSSQARLTAPFPNSFSQVSDVLPTVDRPVLGLSLPFPNGFNK